VSRGNVELHHRAVEAFNRRDLDALLAVMDPEVTSNPRLASVEGSFRGHDGIRSWWDNLLDAFPDFSAEIVEMDDLGDVTVAAVRTRGHGAGSETPLDQKIWQVARWQEGKCVWRGTFETRAEALEAARVSE
jgi:ketosteroid isomerase-like protein